jgi:hypothetical protein
MLLASLAWPMRDSYPVFEDVRTFLGPAADPPFARSPPASTAQ